MALFRIEKRFYPAESFVIDFDKDSKKLHVLDDIEIANRRAAEVMTTVNATDDAARGKLFKSIIEACYASSSADGAKTFSDELVHMCFELKSMFETNTILPAFLTSGFLLDDSIELRSIWRERHVPFVKLVNASEWIMPLGKFTSKIVEDMHCHAKMTSEAIADYETYRDFMTNVISHPEYRLSADEAARCIRCLAGADHWTVEFQKGRQSANAGIKPEEDSYS